MNKLEEMKALVWIQTFTASIQGRVRVCIPGDVEWHMATTNADTAVGEFVNRFGDPDPEYMPPGIVETALSSTPEPTKLQESVDRLGKIPPAWQAEFNTQVLCILRMIANGEK